MRRGGQVLDRSHDGALLDRVARRDHGIDGLQGRAHPVRVDERYDSTVDDRAGVQDHGVRGREHRVAGADLEIDAAMSGTPG